MQQIRAGLVELEAGAVALLEQVPKMARAMKPELVKAAEDHIQKIKALRASIEQ